VHHGQVGGGRFALKTCNWRYEEGKKRRVKERRKKLAIVDVQN